MKLYLSSYRIPTPEALFKLFNKGSKVKTAVIPNAQDYYAERARKIKINDVATYLRQLDFAPQTVDLRDYRSKDKLKQELQKYDFIWVMGGNTFCLRYEMRESGFDKIIRDLIDSGVVYGGESAGAVVVGNNLKGVDLADNPKFSEETIWEGLNLIPHFILPHVDNPMFAEEIVQTRELHKNNRTMIELTDSQALIVEGKNQRIVTGKK